MPIEFRPDVSKNTKERVNALYDAIRVTTLQSEHSGTTQFVATLTFRATVPVSEHSLRHPDGVKYADDNIRKFLLTSIYGNQLGEMMDLVERLRVSAMPVGGDTKAWDEFHSILDGLASMSKYMLPNPVDKPV